MHAFTVSDHRHRYDEFVQQMSHWLDSGKVKFREDIVDGLENAPRAFVGLLGGRRFGKLVIRVAAKAGGVKSPRSLGAPPYGDAMTTKKGLNAHDSDLEPA
jgi:hypothetical protein